MGDSEDEYDRKRRDKFRGERAEPAYRGAERITRPRDDWNERDSWPRPRPRDYRGGMRDRGYSPSMEPAAKRMRHDYYGDNYYNHYVPPYHQPAHRGYFFREPPSTSTSHAEGAQQPPMMSFKAFLATQDDNISDSEAIEKYNDYKLEFQRQQLNEFFVAHKDDECMSRDVTHLDLDLMDLLIKNIYMYIRVFKLVKDIMKEIFEKLKEKGR